MGSHSWRGSAFTFPKGSRPGPWRGGQESPREEPVSSRESFCPILFPPGWELGIETGLWVELGDSPNMAIPQGSNAAHWSVLIYWLERLALKDVTQLCTLRCPKTECNGDWRHALTLISGLLWGFTVIKLTQRLQAQGANVWCFKAHLAF